MKAGLLLEQKVETFFHLNNLPLRRASTNQDLYRATDFLWGNTPVQITLGKANKHKIDWTLFASGKPTILIEVIPETSVPSWNAILKRIAEFLTVLDTRQLSHSMILSVSETKTKARLA